MNDPQPLDPQFQTGIPQIDREHQQLFDIIFEVDRVLGLSDATTRSIAPAIETAINRLVDYTRAHFASEEALMASTGYPGLDSHRQLHARLLRHVEEMRLRADLGDEATALDFSRFLADWLISHILAADKDFGRFSAKQSASGTPG